MRVVVAGGGIGGMATAVALAKVGLEPLVLEQAGVVREIGAGLGLAANAMKALAWLGAAAFVRERAVLTEANVWCELETGAEIGSQPFAPAAERYGENYYCAHRGDLLESLVRLVPPERGRLNARVVGFEETPRGVRAQLASGEEVEGNALVGADGLRSRVRATLLGGETGTGWLYVYDAATAAEAVAPPAPPALRRPGARRAAVLWRKALTLEDRAGLWRGERAGYERFLLRDCPRPKGVDVEPVTCKGVPALRVGRGDGPAVLHLHGGGFVLGSARAAVGLAARVAASVGGWALVPDYRLAPEEPFPAALDDVLSAYRWLLAHAGETAVSGECAGGALAVSLAVRLRDEDEQLPIALHAVSPFCDLTVSSESSGTTADPWFNRDVLRVYAASYLHNADPRSPLVSPIYADLRELPPLLIHVAADEVLRDDAVGLARAAEAAGVDARLRIVEDSIHSFVLFDFLPEANASLKEFAQLLDAAPARS